MVACVLDGYKCPHFVGDTYECRAGDTKRLECAIKRIEIDNAVCICGCPANEHESQDEGSEQCGHEDHDCIRVCTAARTMYVAMRNKVAEVEDDNCYLRRRLHESRERRV